MEAIQISLVRLLILAPRSFAQEQWIIIPMHSTTGQHFAQLAINTARFSGPF